VDVTALTQARDDDINALCARHVVALSALGYYPNALDPDSEVARRCVAHLKNVIVAAQALGLKTVNTFAGRDWTKSVDDNWPRFLRTWRPLITFAEDHGIRIGIGNCPMHFTATNGPAEKTS
jgi:sugar phosphate isomerase/epimerase